MAVAVKSARPDAVTPNRSLRILLSWEGGAGRGHIVTLRTIAQALGPGHVYEAALCRMDHAAELADVCELVYPGAALYLFRRRRREQGRPSTATWAEFLGDLGFAQPRRLWVQLDWWVDLLRSRRIDLVVGDFAPLSLLAARIVGIPAVSVGTGYSVIPAGLDCFPVLLPEYHRLIYDEADLLANVNAALDGHGMAPLIRFSDIYAGAVPLARTIEALDPYAALRQEPYLPPLGAARPGTQAGGDEVFIYFSTQEKDNAELMAAIASLDMPVRGYFPSMSEAQQAGLAASGIIVEPAPVPLDLLAARSRLMLHAGQHGSLCMALGMGLPQLAFPQHLEHLYHARRAEALGPVRVAPVRGWNAATIRAVISEMYHDAGLVDRAHQLATRLGPELYGDADALVRQQLAPLLA